MEKSEFYRKEVKKLMESNPKLSIRKVMTLLGLSSASHANYYIKEVKGTKKEPSKLALKKALMRIAELEAQLQSRSLPVVTIGEPDIYPKSFPFANVKIDYSLPEGVLGYLKSGLNKVVLREERRSKKRGG